MLIGINARYIHVNIALRYLQQYCRDYGYDVQVLEFTINNKLELITSEILKSQVQVLGLSSYIWNINLIETIAKIIKKVAPNIKIVVGGPEPANNLLDNHYVDYIVQGEGEGAFLAILNSIKNNDQKYLKEQNVLYLNKGQIIRNYSKDSFFDINQNAFLYDDKEFFAKCDHKIIYYESSRGCPYGCSYCISATDNKLRFLNLDRIKTELKFFLDNKVSLVKFIDRTFNYNSFYCMEIWNYLIENDNLITSFHFEIRADILTTEMEDILKRARAFQFQFEIGVQSTQESTLRAINRKCDIKKTLQKISLIPTNIHKHVDLIVGLPKESYEDFKKSFNDVFNTKADMLQLGFLKILKNSPLKEEAAKWEIVHNDAPPYEVLQTRDISYLQILELKQVEEMVELYYNSKNFCNTLKLVIDYWQEPFDFFKELANYYYNNNYHIVPHKKIIHYEILKNFLEVNLSELGAIISILKFDILINDNIKNLPNWAKGNIDKKQLKEKIDTKMQIIEEFEYDIDHFINYGVLKKEPTIILFNYKKGKKEGHYTYSTLTLCNPNF